MLPKRFSVLGKGQFMNVMKMKIYIALGMLPLFTVACPYTDSETGDIGDAGDDNRADTATTTGSEGSSQADSESGYSGFCSCSDSFAA